MVLFTVLSRTQKQSREAREAKERELLARAACSRIALEVRKFWAERTQQKSAAGAADAKAKLARKHAEKGHPEIMLRLFQEVPPQQLATYSTHQYLSLIHI